MCSTLTDIKHLYNSLKKLFTRKPLKLNIPLLPQFSLKNHKHCNRYTTPLLHKCLSHTSINVEIPYLFFLKKSTFYSSMKTLVYIRMCKHTVSNSFPVKSHVVFVVVVNIRSGCWAGGIKPGVFLCCSILTCGRKLLGLWPSTPGSGNTRSSTPNFSQPDSVILQVSVLYIKTLQQTPGLIGFPVFTVVNLFICFTQMIFYYYSLQFLSTTQTHFSLPSPAIIYRCAKIVLRFS